MNNKAGLTVVYADKPTCELQQFRSTSLLQFSFRQQVISGRGAGKAAELFSMCQAVEEGVPNACMTLTALRLSLVDTNEGYKFDLLLGITKSHRI